MEKEYLWIEYERKNIFGKLKKYELRVNANKLMGELNEMLMLEFGINKEQFKSLISEGFLSFTYEELIERYHEELLEMYSWEINEAYKEELEEEKEYYDAYEEEYSVSEQKARYDSAVYESMFH